ncbi:transposon Tf2-6 polyprotein [Trichonephila clavipes]|nr:transposon Tf2-6 polyprotein [Trichonephila clavipes]
MSTTRVEEDKATDYAHLKQALTEQFPVVRNRSELETRFYASYQNYNQRPPDFVYELLTIHKQLKLDMREEKLLDHIISRCSSQEFRDAGHSASSPFPNRNGQENWQDTRVNNRCTDKSRPQREFNRFEGQGVGDNWRFDSRRQSGQSDHRFNNQSGRKGGSRNGAFRGQNGQNRLKKKGAKFNLSTEAQDAFNKVKRALTEAPVLQLPNFQEQFNLFTDASGFGIGAVLNQNHRPIAFASRTLNKAERNYTVTKRECLALIWALNKFKTYFGTLPVKVITDHAALTKLTNRKNLSSRMIRWALKLLEFNIEWEHRPGVQNFVADVLSRNPMGNVDGPQISFAALRALALNSREQLIREQREDTELGHIYRYLENPDDGFVNVTVCEDWSQDLKLIDGLLFRAKYSTTLGELRVYIPQSLREAIMQELHDLPLASHLGKKKTYLKLRDTCYFPYMRKYIFKYVSTCDRYQKFNYKNALPAGQLIAIVSNNPNEIVTLDVLGPYPASRPERYRFILVITDHFTKWSELIPLRKASAQAIANALFENYISRYGAPISLISGNSPQFISD